MSQLTLFGEDEEVQQEDLDSFKIDWTDNIGVQLGDIYDLDGHRLMCGDATSANNILLLMDGQKADMLITDPPYNIAYQGKTGDKMTILNDSMSNSDFRLFLASSFKTADMVLKPGGVFYIFHADSESYNFKGACLDIEWQVRQTLQWVKNAPTMGRQDYNWQHEPILYGWSNKGSHKWRGPTTSATAMFFNKPNVNELHPTMKPIELYMRLIENNSDANEIILDTFAGSGTVIIASYFTKRKCRMMELDPKYCEVIIKRYLRLTNGSCVKVN